MEALSLRSSVAVWDTTSLTLQDLSDLLWAANGINRPEIGKRTAPSAMNAQDIDIYVFMKKAVYLYNAQEHLLEKVVEGDHRPLVADRQEDVARAPVICLLVSDISRFRAGEEFEKLNWAAIDAGTVSQNISLFCAATGIGTRPRATMNEPRIRKVLKLKDSQHLMLNNPVTYKK
jgi:SagB-type dehydrogenase family enzyme